MKSELQTAILDATKKGYVVELHDHHNIVNVRVKRVDLEANTETVRDRSVMTQEIERANVDVLAEAIKASVLEIETMTAKKENE